MTLLNCLYIVSYFPIFTYTWDVQQPPLNVIVTGMNYHNIYMQANTQINLDFKAVQDFNFV